MIYNFTQQILLISQTTLLFHESVEYLGVASKTRRLELKRNQEQAKRYFSKRWKLQSEKCEANGNYIIKITHSKAKQTKTT